jgi:uncharacterized protein
VSPAVRSLRRLAAVIAGWFFVALGVAGLFLPILQGVLFLLVGVSLLSIGSPRVRLWRQRVGRRYPEFRRRHQAARGWIRARLARLRRRVA